jgi:hypothetical protein
LRRRTREEKKKKGKGFSEAWLFLCVILVFPDAEKISILGLVYFVFVQYAYLGEREIFLCLFFDQKSFIFLPVFHEYTVDIIESTA